ncbi:hypothetical protein, partial [Neisseria arctica]|uniref:hypothetical protein n=1 Tax=Neisseria arctica TaxID=1470200 RepID=UPI001F26AD4C
MKSGKNNSLQSFNKTEYPNNILPNVNKPYNSQTTLFTIGRLKTILSTDLKQGAYYAAPLLPYPPCNAATRSGRLRQYYGKTGQQ